MAKMVPFHRRTEKDDDLILFKDLQKQKRENELNLSLLRPVSSDDYEYDSNAHITEEFPDKAPPNLRTDHQSTSATRGRISNPTSDHRSTSATRGRISNPTSAVVGFRNQDTNPRLSRQSRSPSRSVSHGRKQSEETQKELRKQKERSVSGTGESRTHVMGSKMVEKVVNARKSAINQAERETKHKPLKYGA